MLSSIEGRVLGCLLEKERTVPDQYPLTLNTLVAACNQSTSRSPVMALDEHEVESALTSLKSEGLVRFVHPSHGRSVTRYRQVADEVWALEPPAAALVAVLLLRGPQTVAELRTRTERLHTFESHSEVESVLGSLASAGHAHLGDRAHWQQLLAEEVEVAGPVAVTAAGLTSGGAAGNVAERVAQLEWRVARLEALLADLLPDTVADLD